MCSSDLISCLAYAVSPALLLLSPASLPPGHAHRRSLAPSEGTLRRPSAALQKPVAFTPPPLPSTSLVPALHVQVGGEGGGSWVGGGRHSDLTDSLDIIEWKLSSLWCFFSSFLAHAHANTHVFSSPPSLSPPSLLSLSSAVRSSWETISTEIH